MRTAANVVDWAEVIAVVNRMVGTARLYAVGDSRDFVEEVRSRTLASLAKVLPRTEVRTLDAFVRIVIRNAALRLQRDLIRARARNHSLEELQETVGFEPDDHGVSAEKSIVRAVEHADRRRALVELRRLDPRGTRVLLKRTVRRQSAAEVAAAEGMSRTNVDQTVYRSRRKLRTLLDRQTSAACPMRTR